MSLPTEYDGPWKEALEAYLPEFVAFFFPAAFADIAWDRGDEWLDKELQRAAPDGEQGIQTVDKLVRVWLHDDSATWLLLHLEVQSQYAPRFEERMFRYHTRLYDRFRQEVVSLAILGDEGAAWKPDHFGYGRWGCAVGLTFPTVKLLEYDLSQLERDANPAALVVLAHRTAQTTRRDPARRAVEKVRLTRLLFQRGYDRAAIERLYRFIDWLLRLPPDLEEVAWQQLRAIEEEYQMPYLTYAERRGHEAGLQQGQIAALHDAIESGLRSRFAGEGEALLPAIWAIDEPARLRAILARLWTATTLDELGVSFPGSER